MFLFDYEKTLKMSVAILITSVMIASAFVFFFQIGNQFPTINFGSPPSLEIAKSLEIPLPLQSKSIPLPLPHIEEALSFASERVRPDIREESSDFLVRIKRTNQVKRLTLPARIDLKYEKELKFSPKDSPFWAEIQKNGSDIIARFLIERGEIQEELGQFCFHSEEANIRTLNDFPEASPFRILAEAKILGRDLFLKLYREGISSQRLEMGNQVFEVQEGDFYAWKEGKWQQIRSLEEGHNLPLAKVAQVDDKQVIFDAWGSDGYSRISVSTLSQSPIKTKSDEFLTAVRIRSEKQISCMLDKQCFVLRIGDWVLKEENRWKILRKSDEKNAFLQGKLEGELFVFDRIDLKNGQKNIHGFLVNLSRSQMVPVNVVAQVSQKKPLSTKGKAK